MIVKYEPVDALAAKNHKAFSEIVRLSDCEQCYKYTQFYKESVASLLFFQEFKLGEYGVFVVVMPNYRPFLAKELKQFLIKAKKHYNAKKLWAYSPFGFDIKWHTFFGFAQKDEYKNAHGLKLVRWEQ
jgi:hypothetical protein